MQFVTAPTLKSLKMGLESSNFYQIEGLGELISKISKFLGSFISKVRKIAKMQFMTAPQLKSLIIGLESPNWYQIEGLGELI